MDAIPWKAMLKGLKSVIALPDLIIGLSDLRR
jgi:hypothetical protein